MKRTSLHGQLLAVVLVVLVAVCMHCATIINGTSQSVSVESQPMQAAVVIRQVPGDIVVFEGTTPASCKLARNNAYEVIVQMPGYREERVQINKSFSAVFLGNCLLGGLPGMLVDLITGAYNELKPSNIQVSLRMSSDGDGTHRCFAIIRGGDRVARNAELVVPLERM